MKYCIALLLLLFLASCERDQSVQYHWTRLELENADNSSQWPAVSTADSIAKAAYCLRLNLFPVETSRSKGKFDPYESSVTNSNPIDSINVSSTTYFVYGSDTLAAGTGLNQRFRTLNHNYNRNAVLGYFGLEATAYYNDDYESTPYPKYVDLLLMDPPSNSDYMRFKVFIHMKDGTIFTDSTDIVKLY